jgi:hypothetical protein
LSSAERLRLRQEKSQPLLDSFGAWLRAQQPLLLPKSPIAAGINYTLNEWQALNRYTSDGDLHIDNNVAERTLKLIGMGRDSWLFLGSDEGGKTAAVLFSFTATCKQQGIDTFAGATCSRASYATRQLPRRTAAPSMASPATRRLYPCRATRATRATDLSRSPNGHPRQITGSAVGRTGRQRVAELEQLVGRSGLIWALADILAA